MGPKVPTLPSCLGLSSDQAPSWSYLGMQATSHLISIQKTPITLERPTVLEDLMLETGNQDQI